MSAFLGYLPKATLVVAAVTAAAAWPVHAWAGPEGVIALALAAAVCLVGAILGRIPHLFFRKGPDAIFHAALAGLGLRLLGTLALGAPLLLFTSLPQMPFAVGLVVVYFSLLLLEVRDLVVASRTLEVQDTEPRAPERDGAPTR